MTLNNLLPTYGNWGGPGWSAGKRTQPGEKIDWDFPVRDGLDALFKAHDWAYYLAEEKAKTDPAAASQIIFNADIALMRDIASGNWDSGLYGALYAPLAELAFGAKSLWDLANIVIDNLDQLSDNDMDGDNYLNGGAGADRLEGGSGNDTYITDNGDKVYDSDGIGHVEFYGMTLSGGTQMEGVANTYAGNGGVYTLDPTNKVLTFTKNGTSIEIYDFDKATNELGIVLEDSDSNLGIDIYGPYVQENTGTAMGAITISRTFDYDVTLRLYTQANTATAGADYTNHLGVAK